MAQDPPVNASLVGQWDGFDGVYADVWGDGDYAVVAHFFDAGVHVIDISDPANPVPAGGDGEYRIPSPSEFASAQDVKIGDDLLFIALEADGNRSVDIVDFRDPSNPTHVVFIDVAGQSQPHNLFYDNGYLYIVNSSTPLVSIVDLTSFDPDNPPAFTITQTLWDIDTPAEPFVHDVTVKDGRLYVCAWDAGLLIYDVSDVANTEPTLIGSAPGDSLHSCWPTDDGRFVVTGEERAAGGIAVWEITEAPGGMLTLDLRDTLELTSTGDAFSVHNQIVIGHRLYNSWYQAGLQVFDINPTTGQLIFAASFDTSAAIPNDFNGNWGVYPFLGTDRILLSDIDNGLFVVDVAQDLLLSLLTPTPEVVEPSTPVEVDVFVSEGTESLVPGTVTVFYRLDENDPFSSETMTDLGDNTFRATLPAAPCGSRVEYYFSADGDGGTTFVAPDGAPVERFAFDVFETTVVVDEDFEDAPGWTTSFDGATSGFWERGVPINDPNWPYDPISDSDGSGQCWLTENQNNPDFDNPSNTDIDDGSVTLTSPAFDMSGGNIAISYDYFLNLTVIDGDDRLLVEIDGNDGAGPWTTIAVHATSGGLDWLPSVITQADLDAAGATLTATTRLRFTANDGGTPSIVEAGLDALKITNFGCSVAPCPGADGDLNLDGMTNGADVQFFINAALNGATGDELCHGDFTEDSQLDAADVPPLVAALLGS